jgi:hypothetical protein
MPQKLSFNNSCPDTPIPETKWPLVRKLMKNKNIRNEKKASETPSLNNKS